MNAIPPKLKRISLIAALVLIGCQLAQATHIVGGELNYSCLGNDQYEISLTVYRDCFNGEALMDDPAYIAIFNAFHHIVDTLLISLEKVDTVFYYDDCFLIPDNICVETTTYVDTVTLAPIPGGYHIAYQRCCRNGTIVNVLNPLDVGATYDIILSYEAMLSCNSSPMIKEWPPTFVCVNEPIEYDHSAIDADGDSLVYELCVPFDGGIPIRDPRPKPAYPPPYFPIHWQWPNYSLNNLLGGVPLRIDPENGILTGTPNLVGQFVVGVCVKEYRNGRLLSSTRRDFQYNVIPCVDVTASFEAPDIQCDDLTVNFTNTSPTTNDFIWKFNDPGNRGAISTEKHPSFTFSDTGTYSITLITNPTSVCIDSTSRQVTLVKNSLKADFDFETFGCEDSLIIKLNDLSIDSLANIETWNWRLSGEKDTLSSNNQAPEFVIYNSQQITLDLTVSSDNNCTASSTAMLDAVVIRDTFSVSNFDTIRGCPNSTVQLNEIYNPNLVYNWLPVRGLVDPTVPNPVATVTEPTTYSVEIQDSSGQCLLDREIVIEVSPLVDSFDFQYQVTGCTDSVGLEITNLDNFSETDINSVHWDLTGEFENDSSQEFLPTFNLGQSQTVELSLTVNTVEGCASSLNKSFFASVLEDIEYVEKYTICAGESVVLESTSSPDYLFYQWSPGEGLNNTNISNPEASPTQTTVFQVTYSDSIQFCSVDKEVTVEVLRNPPELEINSNIECDGRIVRFVPNIKDTIHWEFGDGTNSIRSFFIDQLAHKFQEPGDYTIEIWMEKTGVCPDTISLPITLPEINIEALLDYEITECNENGASIILSDQSSVVHGEIATWDWRLNGETFSNEQNPSYLLDQPGQAIISLWISVGDELICQDSDAVDLTGLLISEDIPDALFSCFKEPLALNESFNDSYNYHWFPDSDLDDPFSPNPTATFEESQEVTVSISNDRGCVFNDTIQVNIAPEFEINSIGDFMVCVPDFNTELFAESEQAVRQWWLNDAGDTLTTASELVVTVNQDLSFLIEFEDKNGCKAEETIDITYNELIIPYDSLVKACAQKTLPLQAIDEVDDNLSFQWFPESSIISGGNSPNPVVDASTPNSFQFIATDPNGCITNGSISLVIIDTVPILDVLAEPDTIIAGEFTQLMATDDPDYFYSWIPEANLSDPNIFNPIAAPTETTTYTVGVLDEFGCTAAKEIDIYVLPAECGEPFIFVPSGFTPNGDGENDVLFVRGYFITEMDFMVYDRWGDLVFSSKNTDFGWDGTKNGENLPSGVYGFYLRAVCGNGDIYEKQGNVTLIR